MIITLELTLDEVNLIVAGLGELPAKGSFNLLKKIEAVTIKASKQQPKAENQKEDKK